MTAQNEKAMATTDSDAVTPMSLLRAAQATGSSIEQMQQLMELHLRWEANEARKAYNAAIAAFKTEGIKIIKNSHVQFQTEKGTTEYNHATLGNVVEQITEALSKHQLSHSWGVAQGEGGDIEVICKVAHVMGHSDEVRIKAAPDASGGKNKIQQVGSTITYLERYTLLAALGLATYEQDDDGRKSVGPKAPIITEAQIADLEALIDEVKADVKGFCTFFKVQAVDELPAKHYASAVKMLESKRGK